MTNGGHLLGKVRIFTGSRFKGPADIQWVPETQPRAIVNGFMLPKSGKRIYMSDVYQDGFAISGSTDSLKSVGYTLAHEMGHYVYSLLDEYDTITGYPYKYPNNKAIPSIMNSQWDAKKGHLEYLNFSTVNNDNDFPALMQRKYHGADAWTVLTRSPVQDSAKFTNSYGTRRQYPVLNNRAPSVSDTYTSNLFDTTYTRIRIDLPSSRARDSLKVIWMGNTIDVDLILDRSGSMDGQPFANVKVAAKGFVDAIKTFSDNFKITPSIGITAFSTTAANVYPMTPLTTNIGQIKSAIDALTADGSTAMYDGCLLSLNKLISYSSDSSTRLSMLLTDGEENASSNSANSVIAKATANNIPIFTFGYGNAAYYDNCRTLSAGTGGRFYANLTSAAAVVKFWMNIFDDAADLQHVADVAFSAPAGLGFTVDPTIYSSVVTVNYKLQDANSYCDFTITDNSGALVSSIVTTIPLGVSYPREQIAMISIDSGAVAGASLGEWMCHVSSSGLVSTDLNGTVRITGKNDGTYAVVIANHQQGFYTWPEPLHLSTSITGKNGLITRLDVAATLTSPSGVVTNIVLNDDGVDGDRIAHDGIYSLDYSNYTENGEYTLSVRFDKGTDRPFYAMDGLEYSISPSGVVFSKEDTTFVTDSFVRVKSIVFHVYGVNALPPTKTGSIMGFESDTLWSIISGSGTLAVGTVRDEGGASLQILGNGWQQIKSQDINTAELYGVTSNLSIDIFMGNTQSNPYWTGQVQLFVNCPSANIYNQHIDLVNLTGLPLDQFSTLSFTLPQNIVNILNGGYTDFSFSLSINTNANTGAYYLDNMRFGN